MQLDVGCMRNNNQSHYVQVVVQYQLAKTKHQNENVMNQAILALVLLLSRLNRMRASFADEIPPAGLNPTI